MKLQLQEEILSSEYKSYFKALLFLGGQIECYGKHLLILTYLCIIRI